MALVDLGGGYALRSAGVLDVPFMFELALDGSVSGAFSDSYMSGPGMPKLLATILVGVVSGRNWPRRLQERVRWMVICRAGTEMGFMKLVELRQQERMDLLVAMFALATDHRRRGRGTEVFQRWIRSLQGGQGVIVYCTKYARAMQKIVKATGFQRSKNTGLPVEEYILAQAGDARLSSKSSS